MTLRLSPVSMSLAGLLTALFSVSAPAQNLVTLFDAAKDLTERHGHLDILVNNAMWVRYGEIEDISQDMLQRMVGTGFFSVVWGIQVAAEHMSEGGSVVNVASAAAFLDRKSVV